ncbi:unnamed protein product, partial [Effrenium voratum]
TLKGSKPQTLSDVASTLRRTYFFFSPRRLNSKKIAGVTPARVQGLEENVRRLRTGPVMNELVNHPEWMPLLLDAKGEAMDFPMPEHPAPAPKLKRRAREEPGARAW